MHINSPISRTVLVEEESYLYFGGTAYLGIPQHTDFRKYYLEGLTLFGLSNGTSRNNNIQLGVYDDAESFAASKYGAESCLITSSGYLAAQLTVKQLSSLGEVRYAPATHPALWHDKQPLTQGGFKDWAKALIVEINQSKVDSWVLISNSLNNLYPEIYDFSFIKDINQNKQITLLVDDSHGIGIINKGKGVYATLPVLKHVETVVVASMAKALGIDAGLVLGSKKIISWLKQSHEFLGASPPSAAGLYAFMNAKAIYQEEYQKLIDLTHYLSTALKNDKNWAFIPDFPVFLSAAAEIEKKLVKQRILISSFAYPDKNGALINRIVLSSWHTLADIEELILALTK